MRLSRALDGFYLAKSADNLSPATLSIYKWALDKLIAFTGDVELESITTEQLRRWMIYLRDEYQPRGIRARERLSVASLQDAWRALKSFYSWARRDLGITRPDDIRRPAGESPQVVPFTEDETRALLQVAASYKRPCAARDTAIVLTLLDTGIRVGELVRLTVSDVNTATGEIQIIPHGSGIKSRARVVYLGKSARKAVWRYLSEREVEPRDILFTSQSGGSMTTGAVLNMLVGLGKAAGIAHCHPHRFRHTFSIMFLRNGGNAFVLQKLLGHRSLEMVKRYLRIVESDVQAAMLTASPVDRWKL